MDTITCAGNITLRSVVSDDRAFLLRVYASAREIELSMVPWTTEMKLAFVEHQFDAQSSHYAKEYRDLAHNIILLNGESVGRIYLSRSDPEQIAILDITVLPEFRGRGIATRLVRELQVEAAQGQRSIRIFIEPFNPAQKLFGELGFEVVSSTEANIRFEWRSSEIR